MLASQGAPHFLRNKFVHGLMKRACLVVFALVVVSAAEVESPWIIEQRAFFAAVDADADGELSTPELEAFFTRGGGGGGDARTGGGWGTDGELTPTAFFDVHNMLRHKLKGGKLRRKLNKLLSHGTAVTKAQLTAMLQDEDSPALLAATYMQAHEDRDGNNKLSWTEFLMPHGSAAGPQDEL